MGFIAWPNIYTGMPALIQKKYSPAYCRVALSRLSLAPKSHRIWLSQRKYTAVSTSPAATASTTALPTARLALWWSPQPMRMLTKEQAASPIMVATARASTVRGKTMLVALLPAAPTPQPMKI